MPQLGPDHILKEKIFTQERESNFPYTRLPLSCSTGVVQACSTVEMAGVHASGWSLVSQILGDPRDYVTGFQTL